MTQTSLLEFMSLNPTVETLKFMAGAIDAKADKIDEALTPDRRKDLSEQLETLQGRFTVAYRQFLSAIGKKEEL